MALLRFVCVMVSVSVLAVVFQNYYQKEIDQVIANPTFFKTVSVVRHWLVKTLDFIHAIIYKAYGHLLTGFGYAKEFGNNLMHELMFHGKEWKTILGRYFGGLYKLLLNALKNLAAKYRYYSQNKNNDGDNNRKTDKKYDADDELILKDNNEAENKDNYEEKYHKGKQENQNRKSNEKKHIGNNEQLKKTSKNPHKEADEKQSKKAGGKQPKKTMEKQQKKSKTTKDVVLTPLELSKYDGAEGNKGPYLGFLGYVFDVEKGREHYGPGGGYEFFAGRDASRAFVSGNFEEEGLIDDIEGLQYQDYLGLKDWLQFYHKDYTYVGKVSGRYFTESGEATEYKHRMDDLMRQAKDEQNRNDQDKVQFPPCNSEWSQTRGSTFWCTKKSGGVARNWVGVPRQYFTGGRKRCACVRDVGAASDSGDGVRGDLDDPRIREYEGCDPEATSCDAGNI